MNTNFGGLSLGEAFPHPLRAFWNPVAVLELYSSPDGTQLAMIGDDGCVRVIDAQTGAERLRFIGSRRRIGALIADTPLAASCAAWSPDGERLAVGYEDGSIRIWNLALQEEHLSWAWHSDRITCLSWSPDGQAVASVGDDLALGVWEATSGEERFIYQGPEEWIKPLKPTYPYTCTFAPDSGRLAVACSDSTVRVLTAEDGEEVAFLRCTPLGDELCWSPAGESLLVLIANQGVAGWNPTEDLFQTLLTTSAPLQRMAWSPDGTYVAVSSGSREWVGIWKWEDLLEGRLQQGVAYEGKGIRSVSWLRGHRLALSCAEGIILISAETPRDDEAALAQQKGLFTLKYDPNDSLWRSRAQSHYMIIVAAKAYYEAAPGSILAQTCERVIFLVGKNTWWVSGELDVLSYKLQREVESARLDPSCAEATLRDKEESVRLLETIRRIGCTQLEQLPPL